MKLQLHMSSTKKTFHYSCPNLGNNHVDQSTIVYVSSIDDTNDDNKNHVDFIAGTVLTQSVDVCNNTISGCVSVKPVALPICGPCEELEPETALRPGLCPTPRV